MAYDLALDMATGDLVIQDNDLLMINNAERVAQQIVITLREWLGEWFLRTTDGIPYLEYVLVKNPNMAHIEQIFREAIIKVEGVTSVTSISLTFERVKRSLTVEYEAVTNYGIITNKEVLGYGRND